MTTNALFGPQTECWVVEENRKLIEKWYEQSLCLR